METYICALERRNWRSFGEERLDIAASGLSVFSSLETARVHALKNRRLGQILVRYHLPDDIDFRLIHYTGVKEHLTLTMDPLTALAEFLDPNWWEHQYFDAATTR